MRQVSTWAPVPNFVVPGTRGCACELSSRRRASFSNGSNRSNGHLKRLGALSRRGAQCSSVLATIVIIAGLWRLAVQAPWTPRFNTPPLAPTIVRSQNPAIIHGAQLFYSKSCLYCHTIDGQGGIRGPNLSAVADRLNSDQMIIRISNGGYNMPAYTYNMKPEELQAILAFLQTRTGGPAYTPHSDSNVP
jgi:mono/diheme cytochrome c family protein